jgi:hypothetical protein
MPVSGPIPLYRYRAFKKSPTQQRADRIEALAEQLALARAALEGNPRAALLIRNTEVSRNDVYGPGSLSGIRLPQCVGRQAGNSRLPRHAAR